jgi:hypothetical protein
VAARTARRLSSVCANAAYVEASATIHTDEATVYRNIPGVAHETINHSAGEYVRGDVTTNGIESVFAVLKRGLVGVYHHASPKHLDRYVDEFTSAPMRATLGTTQ